MRNWNLAVSRSPRSKRWRLEPTYEELELGIRSLFSTKTFPGLEPTYEELERIYLEPHVVDRFSLEPTYEELEHRLHCFFDGGVGAFGAYL